MANFRTHIGVAGIASLAAANAATTAGMATTPEAVILCSLGMIGGMFPDIDSDHSVAAHWLFRLLTLATTLMVVITLQGTMPLWSLLAWAAATAVLMRYVVLTLFTRITVHRGLFHSLPAVLLTGLITVALGQKLLAWSLPFCWLAGGFISGGYLLHLLLDELFSVNLANSELKQSFGTALTLFSPAAWRSYLLLYTAVAAGFWLLPMPEQLQSAILHPAHGAVVHLSALLAAL
ncbi:hydrolase [Mariprofundus erugo]|uniref:metal-dependent hydrolase n=1 Tax=Mariprofundus erugo TaxID=2528639 RepID=UPI0010FE2F60|nr:metal-dependent hydrolase [Mariprofundus erugo]TLS77269.1 hydrolase [Mariprofundus erugo]